MEENPRTDHTKPPYIKKLKEIPPFTVWEVDGAFVRSELSNDFVCGAQHYTFNFIPKNELWIDKEMAPGETNFFIAFLLKEFEARAKNLSYEKAFELASRKEKSERHKSAKYLESKNLPKEDLMKKIHKEKLKSYSNDFFSVWVVDGELIRDFCFSDFTEGGHDFVYSFIPKGEIWLDDDLGQTTDRRLVLLHELKERALMGDQNMSYDSAHAAANEIETFCRNHPQDLESYLTKALNENSQKFKPNPKLQEV